MKNRTLFKQEYIDAAMRASNFDNNKYKYLNDIQHLRTFIWNGLYKISYIPDYGERGSRLVYGNILCVCCGCIPLYRNDWNGQKQ